MFGAKTYSLPIAAVTNHNMLSGLKQHEFIVSQCWRSEVRLKSLGWQGYIPF